MKFCLFVFLCFLFYGSLYAQEFGLPFIDNYPPESYKAATQNWVITQDKRGIIYVGNSDGVLEYDGTTWRRITLPLVRALAIDDSGRIFVGNVNDIGYLQANNSGAYEFVSLKNKIPEKDRELDNVRNIKILEDKVFFRTAQKIFILQKDEIQTIYSKKIFKVLF